MAPTITLNARHLALHPRDCYCELSPLSDDGDATWFEIVALYMDGLRVRCNEGPDPTFPQEDEWVLVNLKLMTNGKESGLFPCRVERIDGAEVYLTFDARRHFSILETLRDHPEYFRAR